MRAKITFCSMCANRMNSKSRRSAGISFLWATCRNAWASWIRAGRSWPTARWVAAARKRRSSCSRPASRSRTWPAEFRPGASRSIPAYPSTSRNSNRTSRSRSDAASGFLFARGPGPSVYSGGLHFALFSVVLRSCLASAGSPHGPGYHPSTIHPCSYRGLFFPPPLWLAALGCGCPGRRCRRGCHRL